MKTRIGKKRIALTAREKEALKLIAQGRINKQIAYLMGLRKEP